MPHTPIHPINQKNHYTVFLLLTFILMACTGGGNGGVSGENNTSNLWTWISGSDTEGVVGIYGTKGISDPANFPGSREAAANWIDADGNYWLFGGYGYDSAAYNDHLNDLWRWDGTTWTWISGSDTSNQSGSYGIKGIPDAANVPGARSSATSWIDASGDLWLFGGLGIDSTGFFDGRLNDLWRWDGANWTWVSGNDTREQTGNYGTKGTPDAANVPGARSHAKGWTDASGDLWLFGGWSYYGGGLRNDLWRWDGSNWTWISGSDSCCQAGIYGTKGIPDAANIPGGRFSPASWVDNNGNFWIFGGYGYDSTGTSGYLNDLWRWDGTNWTWVSGSDMVNQGGIYGAKGTPDVANIPAARVGAIAWTDESGNLWLFGGGDELSGIPLLHNDLWRWDGTNWTWISGSSTADKSGVYGMRGIPDVANVPGARDPAASWIDANGNLCLFGGYGYDSAGTRELLNDLWCYQP